MTPHTLAQLAVDLEAAADLIEAIDDPMFGAERGWNLDGWRYRLVPWGECFVHRDFLRNVRSEITVRLSLPLPLRATTTCRFTREAGEDLLPARQRAYARGLDA